MVETIDVEANNKGERQMVKENDKGENARVDVKKTHNIIV